MTVIETFDAERLPQGRRRETRKAFVEKNGAELLAAIDATN